MAAWLSDRSEQAMLRSLRTLVNGLSGRAGAYGITDRDAEEAERLTAAAEEAVARAADPMTRTTFAVAAKREALAAAKTHCLRLANFIKVNPALGKADRAAVGVPGPAVRAASRRMPAPETRPMLTMRGIVPGGHELEVHDSAAPDRRGTPRGLKGLELFVAYSPSHAPGEGLSAEQIVHRGHSLGLFTRGLLTLTHPDERVGGVANYVGRWLNHRGEPGPWSQPVRMILAIPNAA